MSNPAPPKPAGPVTGTLPTSADERNDAKVTTSKKTGSAYPTKRHTPQVSKKV